MKILHVIPGLNNASGPTQVVQHLANHAAQSGHEVSVCYVTGRERDLEVPFDSRVTLHAFPTRQLKGWAFAPEMAIFFNKKIAAFDIVHIHSIWLYPNIAASRAARRAKVPYIIRPAGSLEPWALGVSAWKKKGYFRLIERRIMNRATRIQVASIQESKNIQTFNFQAPTLLIPNGIECAEFRQPTDPSSLRKQWNIPQDAKILLFLSRLAPVKNLEFLGKVFQQLQKIAPQLYFVVAGPNDHSYAQNIQQLYHSLGLDKKCRFIGAVSSKQKAAVYQAADMFILPSLSENFGVAIAEALAAGLPSIVSQNTPWQEVNSYQAGYWLPLEVEKFVKAIQELLIDKSKQDEMRQNALRLAQKYDWYQVSQRTLEVYASILQSEKSK